ncbi:MAG: cbb3-type cytochrome c oxidase subunit 3 [Woeseiaceae bacterium]|nr:cbb3-type cytochrome c oxidase subunit 3 [Woeseiaceae bacterium]
MDVNTLRGLLTLVLMLAFLGVWIWAWSGRRKRDFDESAALPLEDDGQPFDRNREKR